MEREQVGHSAGGIPASQLTKGNYSTPLTVSEVLCQSCQGLLLGARRPIAPTVVFPCAAMDTDRECYVVSQIRLYGLSCMLVDVSLRRVVM